MLLARICAISTAKNILRMPLSSRKRLLGIQFLFITNKKIKIQFYRRGFIYRTYISGNDNDCILNVTLVRQLHVPVI